MKRRTSGFSLVEALVAIAITVVVIVFIITIFPTVRQGMQQSENRANAATLGQSVVEDIRRAGFDKAVSATGSKEFSGANNSENSNKDNFYQKYDYKVTVGNSYEGNANKKLVTVNVEWNESSGKKNLVIETILAKY